MERHVVYKDRSHRAKYNAGYAELAGGSKQTLQRLRASPRGQCRLSYRVTCMPHTSEVGAERNIGESGVGAVRRRRRLQLARAFCVGRNDGRRSHAVTLDACPSPEAWTD